MRLQARHRHSGLRFALTLSLLTFLLSGCIGYRSTLEQVDLLAHNGQYRQALETLDQSRMASSGRDRLLYLMERGVLLNLAGAYRESHRTLQEADDLTEELVTRSLSGEALSFLTSDRTVPYRGEDYESTYLNYYKALNFLALGEYEAAAVEARRVDEKLTWYFDLYEGKNSYREDAFLRLLTGLLYEAYGDPNNALVAYRRSLDAYRNQYDLYRVQTPKLLWNRLLQLSARLGFKDEHAGYLAQAPKGVSATSQGDALLVVLIDRGQIPQKQEAGLLVPTSRLQPVKIAVPVLGPAVALYGVPDVRIDGHKVAGLETVGNLDAIARRSLEDKQGRILIKQAARTVAKEALVRRSENEFGAAAGAIVRVLSILTENADLRAWSLLPSRVEMALVPLDRGTHHVDIVVGGSAVSQQVMVEKGQVVFLHQRFFH